ncbi:hypothetical protein [Nocardiopsis valliformis]|uniref:hypothetical protein n=1 Tax=Nocardiopsis valliformis TaxID=239974 RepID=UPI00036DF708|nr:hypothetical protein [Nocardiopsis valliformis]
MTFLVFVEGDTGGWRVDRKSLTEAVSARWPEVGIDSTHHSEVRSLLWEFETEHGPGEAYLHQGGTCLYMDVWQEDAVWLAIAFRELAPADLDLVFCDEGYTFDVQLRAGATEADLTDLVDAVA